MYRLCEADKGYESICTKIDEYSFVSNNNACRLILPRAQELEATTEFSNAVRTFNKEKKGGRRGRSRGRNANKDSERDSGKRSPRSGSRKKAYRKRPCTYFAAGSCIKGDKCTYIHEGKSGKGKALQHATTGSSTKEENASKSKSKTLKCDYCGMTNHTQNKCMRYKRDKKKTTESVMLAQQGMSSETPVEAEYSEAITSEVDNALDQLDASISLISAIECEEEAVTLPPKVDKYGALVEEKSVLAEVFNPSVDLTITRNNDLDHKYSDQHVGVDINSDLKTSQAPKKVNFSTLSENAFTIDECCTTEADTDDAADRAPTRDLDTPGASLLTKIVETTLCDVDTAYVKGEAPKSVLNTTQMKSNGSVVSTTDLTDHLKISKIFSFVPSFSSCVVFSLMIPLLFASFYCRTNMLECTNAYMPAEEVWTLMGSTILFMGSLLMGVVLTTRFFAWATGPCILAVSQILITIPSLISRFLSFSFLSLASFVMRVGGANPTRYSSNKYFHLLYVIFLFFCLVTTATSIQPAEN